jgi:hypothetical protein
MPRGGARPNSGPKKGFNPKTGTKEAPTISKEMAREALRQIVLREMDALVSAQIVNAKGLSYMVLRDKATGKFLRVGKDAAQHLKAGEQEIEIWEKDPSIQAFTDLFNRALDKPKEQEQDVHIKGGLLIRHENL